MTLRAEAGQNPVLSVATDAMLRAVDTNFLVNGDYLWSDQSGGYILLKSSTAALSSTVLATSNSAGGTLPGRFVFNGFGPSGPSLAPGAVITVANLAALDAVNDAGMTDGQPVFVQSLRSFFYLRHQTVGLNSIVQRNALSGTAIWWRDEALNRSWLTTTDWYVDQDTGDDENDGQTPSTPIQSLSELSRRTCEISEFDSESFGYTLHVGVGGAGGSSQPGDGELALSSSITVAGTVTTGPAVLITAVTNQNAAGNTRQHTTAALAWAQDTFYTLQEVANSRGYVVGNPTGADADTAFFNGSTFINPAPAQHVQALTLPTFTCFNLAKRGNVNVTFHDLHMSDVSADLNNMTAYNSIMDFVVASESTAVNADTVIVSDDLILGSYLAITRSCIEAELSAGAGKPFCIIKLQTNNYFIQSGMVLLSVTAPLGGGTAPGVLTYNGNQAVLDNNRIVFGLANGSSAYSDSSGGGPLVWGTGNSNNIIRVDTNSRWFYSNVAPANEFVVTTSSDDWLTPSANGAWAALPTTDATHFASITRR